MSTRIRRRTVALVGALAVVTSCSSGGDGTSSTAGDTQASAGSGESTAPTSGGTDSSLPDGPDAVFGDGPFDLPVPSAGLDALTSYEATLVLSFDGAADGQPTAWSRSYVMSVTRQPAVRQIVLEVAGDPAATSTLTEIDGTIYEARADGRCIVTAAGDEDGLAAQWEPAGFLSGVVGADAAGDENVDGIAAQHYTFDEQAIGQLDVAPSSGELWVSSADGYLLKYHVDTTGNAAYFGLDAEGTLSYDYSLTQVDAVAEIQLPAGCSTASVDAPVPDDATEVRRSPGRLSFVTAMSVADVLAFTQAELTAAGWAPTAEPEVMGDTTVLELAKGDDELTVVIRTVGSGTSVTVLRRAPAS